MKDYHHGARFFSSFLWKEANDAPLVFIRADINRGGAFFHNNGEEVRAGTDSGWGDGRDAAAERK